MTSATPKIITKSDPKQVVIEWTDGTKDTFSAADLRGVCPCARCVHELTGERMHDPATVPDDLTQSGLRMVGNYAISMQFSDGHNTGIFTFPYLKQAHELRRKAKSAESNRPQSAPRAAPKTSGHQHHEGCNHGPFDDARESKGE